MNTLIDAVEFAAFKHRNQRRKDSAKTPYINHPIEVMTLLKNAIKCQPDLLDKLKETKVTEVELYIGGLFHDLIEDTDTTAKELSTQFGDVIMTIVLECSDDKSLTKILRKKLQIEHVEIVSLAAKLVKLADKYSNIGGLLHNPPNTWSMDEIVGYATWGYAVYKKLKGISKYFDQLFGELYCKKGFDHIPKLTDDEMNAELEKYYNNIKQSE